LSPSIVALIGVDAPALPAPTHAPLQLIRDTRGNGLASGTDSPTGRSFLPGPIAGKTLLSNESTRSASRVRTCALPPDPARSICADARGRIVPTTPGRLRAPAPASGRDALPSSVDAQFVCELDGKLADRRHGIALR